MIKFKVKALEQPIHILPGDGLSLVYREVDFFRNAKEQLLHREIITEEGWYNCFAVLKLPVGMGMIVGKDFDELTAFLEATWPGCGCGPDEGIL